MFHTFHNSHKETRTVTPCPEQDTGVDGSCSHFLAVSKDRLDARGAAGRELVVLPAEKARSEPSQSRPAEPLTGDRAG